MSDNPDAPTFPHATLTAVEGLPVFDIRNGPTTDAKSLMVRATIPEAFNWVSITNMPRYTAVRYTDAYIACYKARFAVSAPPKIPAEKRDVAAFIIGVARAISTSYYGLMDTDLAAGEISPALLRYVERDAQPSILEVTNAATAEQRTILTAALQLTDAERTVLPVLIQSAAAIIPLQGYSLMNTNHHYLSDEKGASRRAFRAVEDQLWRGPSVTEWFEANKELVQDLLWHKSCHPVNLTLKMQASTNLAVKERLVAAGIGAAATRLPAIEPDVKSATSYQTLFNVMKPLFSMFGGKVDTSILDLAISTVHMYPPGEENPTDIPNRSDNIPTTVVNRRTALEWVKQIVERNGPSAGMCYGFYCALSEQAMFTGGGSGPDTLKAAYSLSKLRNTQMSSFITGASMYRDYEVARNKARSRGVFAAPILEIV